MQCFVLIHCCIEWMCRPFMRHLMIEIDFTQSRVGFAVESSCPESTSPDHAIKSEATVSGGFPGVCGSGRNTSDCPFSDPGLCDSDMCAGALPSDSALGVHPS